MIIFSTKSVHNTIYKNDTCIDLEYLPDEEKERCYKWSSNVTLKCDLLILDPDMDCIPDVALSSLLFDAKKFAKAVMMSDGCIFDVDYVDLLKKHGFRMVSRLPVHPYFVYGCT